MKKNVGKIDKTLRLILGVVLIIVGVLTGNWIIGLVGIVPIATALVGWCPLYCPLGVSTCGKESCES